eukprot:TRINITY_DN50329_c0_g1_i1.p1 TRINITY_DN50329_c0_g1~~TRINITY_DN50329_c0_g1_i1.p1  ORF type:complete len:540 (+),score=104.77 TRINITY_DN50329_c0_g1_i1:132-1751(+)
MSDPKPQNSSDSHGSHNQWHLRPELEFTDCIDSWNIRADPSFDAAVLGSIKVGHPFSVLVFRDDWLQICYGGTLTGWCYRKLGDSDALAPLDQPQKLPEFTGTTQTSTPSRAPLLGRSRSRAESVSELVGELGEHRRMAAAAAAANDGSSGSNDLVRATSRLQATMAKLEFLGVDQDRILSVEGSDSEELLRQIHNVVEVVKSDLCRSKSYKHSEFSNPELESCWLSTFFQSLWHSRVFHTLFDDLVRPLPRDAGGPVANALRETWDIYEKSDPERRPVPVDSLVQAWGSGTGDCAEAFAKLQREEILEPLTDQLALVPIFFDSATLTAENLWNSVLQMGVDGKALLALDLMLPSMSSSSILPVALHLVPRHRHRTQESPTLASEADLGKSHRLVAMICYMETFAHYVVFCRRQSESNTWLFFNDLPGLVKGAPQEYRGWAAVAHECARLELRPKVLLYESASNASCAMEDVSPRLKAALKAVAEAKGKNQANESAASGSGSLIKGYLTQGAMAGLIVLVLALIFQQLKEILSIVVSKR